MAYTCPRCGMRSHNPNDEKYRYCGGCHEHTGDVGLDDELTKLLLAAIAQAMFRAGAASQAGGELARTVGKHRQDATTWRSALLYRHEQLRRLATEDTERVTRLHLTAAETGDGVQVVADVPQS